MIVPAPWESCVLRELPRASPRTFHEVFWNIVCTYAGHSSESLRLLQEGAAALSRGLLDGAAYPHEALHPIVPPQLLKEGVPPPKAPMEDLPVVDCCEDVTAIRKLRFLCSQYDESVHKLLVVARNCAFRWGRLTCCERKQLASAIKQERESRFQEDELRACFSDLNLSGRGLCQMTPDVTRFSNLTKLVLGNNPQLTSISHLPPACLVLVACGCSIREVCPSSTLCFLGLAYNEVEQLDFLRGLPELRVLDLTRNAVFSLEETLRALQLHPLLEDVAFVGSPIALQDDYSERMVMCCTRLQRLDHAPVVGSIRAMQGALNPIVADASAAARTDAGDAENASRVVLSVKLVQLTGLITLAHGLLPREERPTTGARAERSSKRKKKNRTSFVGPTYELVTTLSLHGLWGGNDDVVLACEDLSLLPAAVAGSQPQPKKGRLQSVLQPVTDVLVLDHSMTAKVPPRADLSQCLARPFSLGLRVHDQIRFSSGKVVVLTCDIGSFFSDGSSILSSTAIPPRSITLQEPLVISQAALEEKLIHAREIRAKAAVAQEALLLPPINAPELSSSLPGSSAPPSRRRNKLATAPRRINGADLFAAEARKREEVGEMNLLASIEEKRMEELQHLALTLVVELSLGSAPKVLEEPTPVRTKGLRHRHAEKVKRVNV